jgi:hypothetical protein
LREFSNEFGRRQDLPAAERDAQKKDRFYDQKPAWAVPISSIAEVLVTLGGGGNFVAGAGAAAGAVWPGAAGTTLVAGSVAQPPLQQSPQCGQV